MFKITLSLLTSIRIFHNNNSWIPAIFLFVLSFAFSAQASANKSGMEHVVHEFDNHKIHLLKIDPALYEINLVSGHNSVFGRERVESIVKREAAEVGVNAGFFEIGNEKDGMPSGTLVIDGKFLAVLRKEHDCLIKENNKVFVESSFKPILKILVDDKKEINIDRFNRFAYGENIFIYNDTWGKNTFTSHKSRREVVISSDLKVVDINEKCNSQIPNGGYVISLPKDINWPWLKIGSKVLFNWQPKFVADKGTFIVMGIPALIKDGKIINGLNNTVYNARTAFGITKDGQYLVTVVEHFDMQSYKNLSLKEINKMFVQENISYKDLNVQDMQKVILKKFASEKNVIGFSSQELAEFLLQQGCQEAINLDGGGSSSLYIKDNYVNEAYGDKDENNGMKSHRAVASALIFKRKVKR